MLPNNLLQCVHKTRNFALVYCYRCVAYVFMNLIVVYLTIQQLGMRMITQLLD